MDSPTRIDEYPFCLPSFIEGVDDGEMAVRELQAGSKSWRAEKYSSDSNLLVLEHTDGTGTSGYYNDAQIDEMLKVPQASQVRFVVLLPTPCEIITIRDEHTMKTLQKDELGHVSDPEKLQQLDNPTLGELNISRDALLKILTKYNVAPAACSHIRGQEQVFGSRILRNGMKVKTHELWYAIRARAFFDHVEKDGDLKMTMYIQYDASTDTTLVIVKLRSFNNLVDSLKEELLTKLTHFVRQKSTGGIVTDPLAMTILFIQATTQWYRRAARAPRDTVRKEEEKAHGPRKGVGEESTIIRRLHLTMRNLDQDKLQLKFIADLIKHLMTEHDRFYTYVRGRRDREDRDWVFFRVDEELNRLVNHILYQVSLLEDVASRAERLLNLLFSLSAQNNARWNEKLGRQAMRENASVKAIAIVSMIFLPGAFVSSIFGANIFAVLDSDPTKLQTASHWWVLPVAILGSTVFTLAFYYLWQKRRERKILVEMDEEAAVLKAR